MSYVIENRRFIRRLWRALAVLLALAVSGASAQQASANWGGLDPSFAEGGFRIDPFGPTSGNAGAEAAALDSSGRLVVAGPGALDGDITLLRYREDGSLDSHFGVDGVATFQVSASTESETEVAGMYVEQGGGIVVAGDVGRDGFVLRVRGNGSGLDETFGEGGIAAVPGESVVRGLAESEGGKPVVAGKAYPEEVAVVARLTKAGALDAGFGSGGEVKTELPEKGVGFHAVMVDGEEITVAASVGFRAIYLARYDSSGKLLPEFGQEGIATIRLPEEKHKEEKKCPEGERCPKEESYPEEEPYAYVNELTDLSGGHVLLTGSYNRKPLLAKTEPDGAADPTFGIVRSPFYEGPHPEFERSAARSAVVEPDGHIVMAGVAYGDQGRCEFPGGCHKPTTDHLALVRYSSAGGRDGTFGEGGIALHLLGLEQPVRFLVGKALLDQKGRLLVAGSANGDYLAARFLLKEGEYAPEKSLIQEPLREHSTPAEPMTCVVPNLKGKTLEKARRLLARAGCRLGQVVRRPKGSRGSPGSASSTHRGYVVARSKPAAGRTIPADEAVRLILVFRGR